MSVEDLDEQVGEKSSKNKYLTWVIIGIIIIAAIAVPMVIMRQSEPTEATEPTTIEEIQTEVQTLWDTVYGTDGLETKIALHAESIADFVAGECPCPDYSGQFQNIDDTLTLLRTDLNAVPDYASNITQVNTDLTALSTEVEATLLALQAQVDTIVVTDWGSDISALDTRLGIVEADVTTLNTQIDNLDTALTTVIDALADAIAPRYAMVTAGSGNDVQIAVYGSGNFPVVVTFYGDALTVGSVSISSLYPYSVGSYYLYGGYTLTEVINDLLDETGGAITSGIPPNEHTHEVIVPYPDGELNLNGTMLVAIIVPDDDWEDGDDIILEVTAGTVKYVTATTG